MDRTMIPAVLPESITDIGTVVGYLLAFAAFIGALYGAARVIGRMFDDRIAEVTERQAEIMAEVKSPNGKTTGEVGDATLRMLIRVVEKQAEFEATIAQGLRQAAEERARIMDNQEAHLQKDDLRFGVLFRAANIDDPA